MRNKRRVKYVVTLRGSTTVPANPSNQFELSTPGSAVAGSGLAAVSRIKNSMEVWWIGANGSVQAAFMFRTFVVK
jgi:hypothetical protein